MKPKWILPGLAACSLLAAAAIVVTPAPARASTVAGSEYAVTFSGTGSENRSWDAPGSWTAEQTGTWAIEDSRVDVWLPAAYDAAEEGLGETAPTHSIHDGQQFGEPSDPASLTETGTGESAGGGQVSYTCTASVVDDRGVATLSAGVALGSLAVGTAYTPNRRFELLGDSEGEQWSCDAELQDAPEFVEYPRGEASTIGYAATVPFADVGAASFTLPVTDTSTVDLDPYCGAASCSVFQFGIAGSYSFEKLCDGSIDYSGGAAAGTCGAATPTSATPPGAGSGGGPAGTKRPSTRIAKHPGRRVKTGGKRARVRFAFTSGSAGASFKCKLDKAPFKPCHSPRSYRVKLGHHTFQVEAIDAAGPDRTAARFSFSVVKRKQGKHRPGGSRK